MSADTVERRKSKVPAAAAILSASFVMRNSCAPSDLHSSFLSLERDSAVTWQPRLLPNWMAMWPRPPMPMMPTR